MINQALLTFSLSLEYHFNREMSIFLFCPMDQNEIQDLLMAQKQDQFSIQKLGRWGSL